jgi:pyridoxal phosphate enzyme (YggS family)
MDSLTATLRTNVDQVRQRIAAAARSCSRDPESVRLVAVSKYVDEATTRALAAAGVRDLGESRPQQLWAKADALRDLDLEWHLVGHLQRNKLRRTLETASWIHSCDSLRLLRAVDQESDAELGSRVVNLLLEVNISGDASKTGFAPSELRAAVELAGQAPGVRVRGLMGMAALEGGLPAAERDFAALARLRDDLRSVAPAGVSLDELSMGMSHDFEIAVRHGATMVRIGSALFAGVEGFD